MAPLDILKKCSSAIRSPAVWIPAVILAVATALFWWTDLDIALLRPFYSGDAASASMEARWPLMAAQPWKALYDWGVYPAWVLGCGGMAVWIASFFPAFIAVVCHCLLASSVEQEIAPGTASTKQWHTLSDRIAIQV